jgi:hypothetical protein
VIKKILKYIRDGILWGWGFFIVTYLIFDLAKIEPVRTIVFDNFSKNVLASTITGIGFGTTSIVYEVERLRRWQQTLIHFGVGMSIYFPVAFSMNWIPTVSSPVIIFCVLLAVMGFFLIWSGFYLYDKAETKKINERLKEIEREREI